MLFVMRFAQLPLSVSEAGTVIVALVSSFAPRDEKANRFACPPLTATKIQICHNWKSTQEMIF
jgi:hypothetical protein